MGKTRGKQGETGDVLRWTFCLWRFSASMAIFAFPYSQIGTLNDFDFHIHEGKFHMRLHFLVVGLVI